MGFLDSTGLRHFFDKLHPQLVKGVTQAEYEALPEEKQKAGMYVITDADGGGGSGGSSEGEIYSKEETMIGLYSGNRPVYRIVRNGTLKKTEEASNVKCDISLSELDIGFFVNAHFNITHPTKTVTYFNNYSLNGALNITSSYNASSGIFSILLANPAASSLDAYVNTQCRCVFEYVKKPEVTA